MKNTVYLWVIIGLVGIFLLPWYAVEDGFWTFSWLATFTDFNTAPAVFQALLHQRWWLIPSVLLLLVTLPIVALVKQTRVVTLALVSIGVMGLLLTIGQGFFVERFEQVGMGAGGLVLTTTFLFLLTTGISRWGRSQGDAFIIGLIGAIIALVVAFVYFPVGHILIQAFELEDGSYGVANFLGSFFSSTIWGLNCLTGEGNCGPGINSVFLAILTGLGTTLLGLSFALIATRTDFRAKPLLRVLTVLPIITPPFVIGLALILLFGRAGVVSDWMQGWFDVEKTRWLYGFWGVFLAQLLSFTPIAFLVMIGVVEGVSPSMEEASQTMNASRWQTFRRVSFPLMRPGLANAFLLGFIESLADFGNPLVLGGDYTVLSTEIYFAIVGAVADPSKAAILSISLLTLTITAFLLQRWWVGKKSYATVTGKGDSGQHCGLDTKLKWACYVTAIPWATFTVVVYSMIIYGSFVKLWGYDNSFTLEHYSQAFGINFSDGIEWVGSAWSSYFTTLKIASVAAPLTALVGLATAYLLVRQHFAGKNIFEFSTMLSFAIPGTVVGISYILAFNVAPLELTGTGIILIIAFIFRNMPVGVRGGIAAMSQLDKSLDEASLTLGANSFTTVRRVILPLLGPAILAALIYSFVRAITSVSAVIFLVSAEHNMATSFIVGRVENGEFGIAIAYSAVLIITMLAAILLLQLAVGKRKLRRNNRVQA